jgi:hypothetical protein
MAVNGYNGMTNLQQVLLENAESYWVNPTPSLENILNGGKFNSGDWDGWWQFIPPALQKQWKQLSHEARVVAYCVAVQGVNHVQDLLDDN